MADWADKDYCLDRLENYYVYSLLRIREAEGFWTAAWKEIYWEIDLWGFAYEMLDLTTQLIQAIKMLQGYDKTNDPWFCVPYFLTHHSLSGWKSICEAWAYNNFEGRDWTIACIDRMRQILWDEPFYIKWAAKPEINL